MLSRQQILKLWRHGESNVRLGRSLDSLPPPEQGAALALTTGELKSAFDPSWWWPAALDSMAAAFCEPLRFCLDCATQGYHTNLFQLPWWICCPIHRSALLHACPDCGGALNGLRLRFEPALAFQCSRCSRDMVDTVALINASRRDVTTRLHHLVGIHRRWCRDVSEAFAVHPILVVPNCELDAESVTQWISASNVAWPDQLKPFVTSANSDPQRGIRMSCALPAPDQVEALSALNRTLRSRWLQVSAKTQQFAIPMRPIARALVRLDERLRDLAGEGTRRSHSLGTQLDRHDAQIRRSGLRRREGAMRLEKRGDGRLSLVASPKDWAALGSFRLLCHLTSWLQGVGEIQNFDGARAVVSWWHSHLLAITLTDATAAATQAGAWMPPVDSRPDSVEGWPLIDLERHAPGHSWVLGATVSDRQLVAFLEPVTLAHLLRPDSGRIRELHDSLGREQVVYPKWQTSPFAPPSGNS